MPKERVLSMGTAYLDINSLSFPTSEIGVGRETVGKAYEVVPGGSALNAARMFSAMNLESVFIGKIGQDVMGATLQSLLEESGVEPSLIVSPVLTNLGLHFVSSDGESVKTVVGDANKSLHPDEVMQKVAEQSKHIQWLYLGECYKMKSLLSSYETIAKMAQDEGIKVVLDHGRVTNGVSTDDISNMLRLLPRVDYYLPSKEEFLSTMGLNTIEKALEEVQCLTDAKVVVKDEENDVIGIDNDIIHCTSTYDVPLRSNVGAGDSFNAGFIKAQSMGWDFEHSLKFGCATAALKISEPGIPTFEKVYDFFLRQEGYLSSEPRTSHIQQTML